MKAGVAVSSVLHAAILTWGLWSLGAPEPLEVANVESLPVELVPVEEYSQSLIGKKDAPVTETPAPEPTEKPAADDTAQNVGENSVDLDSPPTPTERERAVEQTAAPVAAAPPPQPEPSPEPVPQAVPTPRPEPSPQPAEVAQPQEPAPAEPTPAEADPIEEAIATAEAQPEEKPEPQPEPEQKPAPTPEAPQVASLPDRGPVPQVRPSPPRPAQTETKKPEKPVEKPVQAAEDDSEFDPDKIAALLNKEKSAGGGAKRSQQQASLGGDRRTGAKLSMSELDALRGQVSQCWSPPAGVSEAGSLRVTIRMRLDPSGGLEGRPELVDGGSGSTIERAAGDAALRAVIRCAPYKLPPEKYDTWSEVLLNFDPSQML
ncbi:hypothetical protein [Jiella pacifica]|uniref:Cell division and transport-associated protein TolA n=1 Tax=Jiella pacifica TaxID=2696469 RepID=A0A6N9SYV7_9HYPH|nr:hypothetical protein [Jiella pacifica]NDW04264.1 hypothetical protein [Jiella pacifica]